MNNKRLVQVVTCCVILLVTLLSFRFRPASSDTSRRHTVEKTDDEKSFPLSAMRQQQQQPLLRCSRFLDADYASTDEDHLLSKLLEMSGGANASTSSNRIRQQRILARAKRSLQKLRALDEGEDDHRRDDDETSVKKKKNKKKDDDYFDLFYQVSATSDLAVDQQEALRRSGNWEQLLTWMESELASSSSLSSSSSRQADNDGDDALFLYATLPKEPASLQQPAAARNASTLFVTPSSELSWKLRRALREKQLHIMSLSSDSRSASSSSWRKAILAKQQYLFPTPVPAAPVFPASSVSDSLLSCWIAEGELVTNGAFLKECLSAPSTTVGAQPPRQKQPLCRRFVSRLIASSSCGIEHIDTAAGVRPSSLVPGCRIRFDRKKLLASANVLYLLGILEFQGERLEQQQQQQQRRATDRLTAADIQAQERQIPCLAAKQHEFETTPLAACVITKDRAASIIEFIQHHRMLGVSKFFIYDDSSIDNTLGLLQPFIDAGVVALIPVRDDQHQSNGPQAVYYQACVDMINQLNQKKKKKQFNQKGQQEPPYWAMFIDTDEMVFLADANKSPFYRNSRACLPDRVAAWRTLGKTTKKSEANEEAVELPLPWRFVAPSSSSSASTISESTRFSAGHVSRYPMTTKPIFNPAAFRGVSNPHSITKAEWGRTVFADGRRIATTTNESGSNAAHYMDRSPGDMIHSDLVLLHYYYGGGGGGSSVGKEGTRQQQAFLEYLRKKTIGRADMSWMRYDFDLASVFAWWRAATHEETERRARIVGRAKGVVSRHGRTRIPLKTEHSQSEFNVRYLEMNVCLRCLMGYSNSNNNGSSRFERLQCGGVCAEAFSVLKNRG